MHLSKRKVSLALCLIVLAVYASITAEPVTKNPSATPPAMVQAEYDGDGKMLRPVGFEKWVVVGTSIGLDYSEGAKRDANNPGTIHNVYLQPEAFDHYVRTGEFPEQSVFIVTNHRSQPAKTKGPVSRIGFVAAPTAGLEVSVKDSKRFTEGWGYFMFHDEPGDASEIRSATKVFEQKDCFDCHAEHGAVDNVFTQFYSVLTHAREKHLSAKK